MRIREGWFGGVFPTWLVPSARLRITLIYWWRHGRPPRLRHPRRFTELVQRRKLADRDWRLVSHSDKVAVKDHVAAVLGADWTNPTVWHGRELPAEPPSALPLVVKARHGCGQIMFVRTHADWDLARRRAPAWLSRRYGRWLDEWAYAHIPRGILVEPMLGDGGTLPVDYKFIVIGGRVACIEVHVDRATAHRWSVLSRDWALLSSSGNSPTPPASLAAMIAGAERLGAAHDCVRIDLYEVDGRPVFGEMTFYPGSGFTPIAAPGLDAAMGAAWLCVLPDQGAGLGSDNQFPERKRSL